MAELTGFGEFVAARSGTLMRLGYLLTGDHQHAEDLLQTALLHTAQRWRKITDPNAYARRVMVNECTSWWRRRRIREHSTEHPPDRASGEDTADDVVRRDAFVRALRTLPPRQRAVIALRFYDDLSEAETARVLGCAVGTVKSQTHNALARLRDALPDLADDRATVAGRAEDPATAADRAGLAGTGELPEHRANTEATR